MADAIKVDILENGLIRMESGKVSMLNHSTAEAFLRFINEACGGAPVERKHRHGAHLHTHDHGVEDHAHA